MAGGCRNSRSAIELVSKGARHLETEHELLYQDDPVGSELLHGARGQNRISVRSREGRRTRGRRGT